eukprot:1057461-Pelagomonas_calceolata.AAC.2
MPECMVELEDVDGGCDVCSVTHARAQERAQGHVHEAWRRCVLIHPCVHKSMHERERGREAQMHASKRDAKHAHINCSCTLDACAGVADGFVPAMPHGYRTSVPRKVLIHSGRTCPQ